MQRLNTFLLLVAIALLAALWMRPQAGRFVWLESEGPYALDTATGQVVLLKASPEAQHHFQNRAKTDPAEQEQQREERLAQTCPQILSGANPNPGSLWPFERRVQECKDWQALQSTPAK